MARGRVVSQQTALRVAPLARPRRSPSGVPGLSVSVAPRCGERWPVVSQTCFVAWLSSDSLGTSHAFRHRSSVWVNPAEASCLLVLSAQGAGVCAATVITPRTVGGMGPRALD